MYHSVTFGTKNSWDDWRLIPNLRPRISPPFVKSEYLDVPGRDGPLDMTEALAGRPTYGSRTGSFEFIVQNGFRQWTELYSEIMNHLHGKRMRLTLEDDPNYYYEGRLSVNDWKSDPNYSIIVIDYQLDPYKTDAHGTLGNWLWDPFRFETDIAQEYSDLVVDGELSIIVVGYFGSAEPPVIIASGTGLTVTFDGVVYALEDGRNVMEDIRIGEGENVFTFHGSGVVSFDYKGVSL